VRGRPADRQLRPARRSPTAERNWPRVTSPPAQSASTIDRARDPSAASSRSRPSATSSSEPYELERRVDGLRTRSDPPIDLRQDQLLLARRGHPTRQPRRDELVFVNATGNELNYDRGTGERVGLLLLVMVGLFIVVRARRVESVQDEVVDVLLDRLVPSFRTAEKPNRPVSNAAGDRPRRYRADSPGGVSRGSPPSRSARTRTRSAFADRRASPSTRSTPASPQGPDRQAQHGRQGCCLPRAHARSGRRRVRDAGRG
jgi:hypothetical protein